MTRVVHFLRCGLLPFTLGGFSNREVAPNRVRRDLRDLNERDIMSLKAAMMEVQRDEGTNGWKVSHKL